MKLQNLHQPSTLDRLKHYPYPVSAPGIVLPSCHTEFLSTLNSTKLLEAARFAFFKGKLLSRCCWGTAVGSAALYSNRSTESPQMSSLEVWKKALPPCQIGYTVYSVRYHSIFARPPYLVPSSSRSKRRKRAANARYSSQYARLPAH